MSVHHLDAAAAADRSLATIRAVGGGGFTVDQLNVSLLLGGVVLLVAPAAALATVGVVVSVAVVGCAARLILPVSWSVAFLVVALSEQAAHPGSGHRWFVLVLLAVVAYAAGAVAHTSGFLATYVAALLVVTTTAARAKTERRIRSVSRGGRLAGWSSASDDSPPARS